MSLSNPNPSLAANEASFDDQSPPNLNQDLGEELSIDNELDTSSRLRRFGFKIGELSLLVKEGLYCEMLVDAQITPLPNAPKHVAGLINLRGNIIPVYSLSSFVGIEKTRYKYAYLIGEPEQGAALLIDEKPRLVDLTESQATETRSGDIPELIVSCGKTSYNVDTQRWISLDHEQLFTQLAKHV